MSGGKIIPVIAQGDREGMARIEAASDRLHDEYVAGFQELRQRIVDLETSLLQEMKYNDAELFRQVDNIRVEARAGLADLVAFMAELRKRIEKLEQGGGTPKLNG